MADVATRADRADKLRWKRREKSERDRRKAAKRQRDALEAATYLPPSVRQARCARPPCVVEGYVGGEAAERALLEAPVTGVPYVDPEVLREAQPEQKARKAAPAPRAVPRPEEAAMIARFRAAYQPAAGSGLF